MGILALEDIQPGMVLASDLRTSHGRLILPGLSVLDADHLRTARIWGITEADIQGVFAEQAGKNVLDMVPAELRETYEEILAFRFANCDLAQPPVRRLMELFMLRSSPQEHGMDPQELLNRHVGPDIRLPRQARGRSFAARPVLGCEEMLQKDPHLTSLPDVFHAVVEAARSPRASAACIAEVIGRDPSLSSRLLRMVNSALYSFEHKVDTLSRAVAIVGALQITNLALGVSVTSVFRGIPPQYVDMHAFWEHSLAVGVISRLLGTHLRIPIRERVFVAGLMHDIGRLVIYRNHVQQAQALIALAMDSAEPMNELEREAWGFTHADLGAMLLGKWRIPESIQGNVACHHVPLLSRATDETRVVHLADVIAHSLGFGHTGLRRVPPLCIKTWDRVGLPVSALSTLAVQAENQLRDLMRVVLTD